MEAFLHCKLEYLGYYAFEYTSRSPSQRLMIALALSG